MVSLTAKSDWGIYQAPSGPGKPLFKVAPSGNPVTKTSPLNDSEPSVSVKAICISRGIAESSAPGEACKVNSTASAEVSLLPTNSSPNPPPNASPNPSLNPPSEKPEEESEKPSLAGSSPPMTISSVAMDSTATSTWVVVIWVSNPSPVVISTSKATEESLSGVEESTCKSKTVQVVASPSLVLSVVCKSDWDITQVPSSSPALPLVRTSPSATPVTSKFAATNSEPSWSVKEISTLETVPLLDSVVVWATST